MLMAECSETISSALGFWRRLHHCLLWKLCDDSCSLFLTILLTDEDTVNKSRHKHQRLKTWPRHLLPWRGNDNQKSRPSSSSSHNIHNALLSLPKLPVWVLILALF